MVERAGNDGDAVGRPALGELLTRYLPALRAHLIVTKQVRPDQAEDLLQSFVSCKFLGENLAGRANRSIGKFRTYVLTVLDHFLVSEFRKTVAQVRGGGRVVDADPEHLAAIPSHVDNEADVFSVAWARELLAEALSRMEVECRVSEREDVWGVFDGRLLGPILRDEPMLDYPTLIEKFGFNDPGQAANALVTAKRVFQRHLRAVIAEYADSDEEIEEEIRDVLRILMRAGAGPASRLRIQR